MSGINAQRARNGERPTCWNREDYPEFQTVQDGLRIYQEPRQCCDDGWGPPQDEFFVPVFRDVWNPMSRDCKSWAVRAPDPNRPGDPGEDPATESIPGQEGWLCWGCRHLPDDPRVRQRAIRSEPA